MRKLIHFYFIILVSALTVSCSDQNNIKADTVYSVEIPTGKFAVVKVIAVKGQIVQIKPYKNTYDSRPSKIDTEKLNFASLNNRQGSSIDYVTLDKKAFDNWKPRELAFTP